MNMEAIDNNNIKNNCIIIASEREENNIKRLIVTKENI